MKKTFCDVCETEVVDGNTTRTPISLGKKGYELTVLASFEGPIRFSNPSALMDICGWCKQEAVAKAFDLMYPGRP